MKKPQTAHDIAEHFVLRAENKFVRDYEKALAKGQPAQLQSIEYVVVEMMAKEILRLRKKLT